MGDSAGHAAKLSKDTEAELATILSDAIAARGVATIAVSGGRSPRPVLEALSKVPLDWTRLIVTLVDERWVEPVSADSNERLVRETLLQGPAAAARFVPRPPPSLAFRLASCSARTCASRAAEASS